MPKPRTLIAAAAVAAVLSLAGCGPSDPARTPKPSATATAAPTAAASAPPVPALTRSEIAALPAAVYDAVIPGLLPAPVGELTAPTAHRVMFDAPLFGADRATPVARIPATDFRGQRTVVVPIRLDGPWALVLTPARQVLPSQVAVGAAAAPAQTAAWMPAASLAGTTTLAKSVRISVGEQSLSVLDASGAVTASWKVGVGTDETPTPTGVTGYLQARYTDPDQGQSVHPIQLTSLHATAADEPFGGSDGGLIGIHYFEQSSGAVSHGCVRLPADALTAVNALPLGTLVVIEG